MMKCPSCGSDIHVSMYDILSTSSITCPACGLRMEINKSKSQKALDALEKLKKEESKE